MTIWLTLALMAFTLSYQLFVPPIVGLADQGDYARIIGRFGYGPQVKKFEERYYLFLNRTYVPDPGFRARTWESATSQYLLTGAAVLLNSAVSRNLDICVMGAVHAAVFLLAAFALLGSLAKAVKPAVLAVVGVALIFVFCDAGYISYFNSFFTEPASFLFLFCLLAAWARIIVHGVTVRPVLLWFLAALLFTTAKLQNVPLGLMLAAYSIRLGALLPARGRRIATAAAGALAGVSLTLYFTAPQPMKDSASYDMLFMGILPQTSNPDADLRAFGLDPALREYNNTGAWSPKTAFANAEIMQAVRTHVSPRSIAWFYAKRPARLWKLTRTALPKAMSLRAEFSGNFERRWGYPPLFRSQAFSEWSRFREYAFRRVALGLLLFLAFAGAYAGWRARRSKALTPRLFWEAYALCAAMALTAFGVVVIGDSYDMTKHFFIFNVLADLCLVAAVATIATRTVPWRRFARRHPEASAGHILPS